MNKDVDNTSIKFEHKFKRDFKYVLNSLCSCSIEVEMIIIVIVIVIIIQTSEQNYDYARINIFVVINLINKRKAKIYNQCMYTLIIIKSIFIIIKIVFSSVKY